MNNFGPSVKAVRKASTHLTEEPIKLGSGLSRFGDVVVYADGTKKQII